MVGPHLVSAAASSPPAALDALLGAPVRTAAALVLDALLAAVLAAYLASLGRWQARGRAWRLARPVAFSAGLLVVFATCASGLGRAGAGSVPVQATRQVLLEMVAPPLVLLGRPLLVLGRGGPRWWRRRAARRGWRRVRAVLTGPLAWVGYFGLMWAALLSPLYAAGVRAPAVRAVCDAALLGAGLAYWASVVDPGERSVASATARGLGLCLGAPLASGLGLLLVVRESPLYGASLAGTRAGGELFWGEAMTVLGVAVTVVLLAWTRAEVRGARSRAEHDPASLVADPVAFASAAGELVEEARRVLGCDVADPGDVLIRPDEDEP